MSALHEGPARQQTGHRKGSKATFAAIFNKKNVISQKTDFKTISFESFILWEIVARKHDFDASEHQ